MIYQIEGGQHGVGWSLDVSPGFYKREVITDFPVKSVWFFVTGLIRRCDFFRSSWDCLGSGMGKYSRGGFVIGFDRHPNED